MGKRHQRGRVSCSDSRQSMGRPMPDHSQLTSPEEARSEALKLITNKDGLEKELQELHSNLQSMNADLGVSLVDSEGFPRGDIDVYSVRLARVRTIELRNDIKALSDQIKSLLEVALARPPESSQATASTSAEEGQAPEPFAIVNGVAPGSPASSAGLLRGDKLLRFGSVNSSNHQGLRAVATEVSKNENRTVTISVLREEATVSLVLVPKTWSGRGLLGCHIFPV